MKNQNQNQYQNSMKLRDKIHKIDRRDKTLERLSQFQRHFLPTLPSFLPSSSILSHGAMKHERREKKRKWKAGRVNERRKGRASERSEARFNSTLMRGGGSPASEGEGYYPLLATFQRPLGRRWKRVAPRDQVKPALDWKAINDFHPSRATRRPTLPSSSSLPVFLSRGDRRLFHRWFYRWTEGGKSRRTEWKIMRRLDPSFIRRVWDDIERERGNWWCRGLKIGVMDDRDFKINLAFHEYCSILNDTSLCFSYSGEIDRDFRFFSSIYRWKDTGGDRVENYEKIVRCFIEIREKKFLWKNWVKNWWSSED